MCSSAKWGRCEITHGLVALHWAVATRGRPTANNREALICADIACEWHWLSTKSLLTDPMPFSEASICKQLARNWLPRAPY